jgi:hypothetical protein
MPFPKVEIKPNLIYDRQPFVAGLGRSILNFAAGRPDLADPDTLTAIEALAETYRTLISGIYYAKPPEAPLSGALYAALENFVRDYKQQESRQAVFVALKDTEIFHLLVFLARVGRSRTNRRPRARIFLEFLRAQFPAEQAPESEASRIIIP